MISHIWKKLNTTILGLSSASILVAAHLQLGVSTCVWQTSNSTLQSTRYFYQKFLVCGWLHASLYTTLGKSLQTKDKSYWQHVGQFRACGSHKIEKLWFGWEWPDQSLSLYQLLFWDSKFWKPMGSSLKDHSRNKFSNQYSWPLQAWQDICGSDKCLQDSIISLDPWTKT